MKSLKEIIGVKENTLLIHGVNYTPCKEIEDNKNIVSIEFEKFKKLYFMVAYRRDRVELRKIEEGERNNLIPYDVLIKGLKLAGQYAPEDEEHLTFNSEETFEKEKMFIERMIRSFKNIIFLSPDSFTLDRNEKMNSISSINAIIENYVAYNRGRGNIYFINEPEYVGTGLLLEEDKDIVNEKIKISLIKNNKEIISEKIKESIKENKETVVILNNNKEIQKLKEEFKDQEDVFIAYELSDEEKYQFTNDILNDNKYKIIICNDVILNIVFKKKFNTVITSCTSDIRTFCDRATMSSSELYLIDITHNEEDSLLDRPYFFCNTVAYKLQCLITNTVESQDILSICESMDDNFTADVNVNGQLNIIEKSKT